MVADLAGLIRHALELLLLLGAGVGRLADLGAAHGASQVVVVPLGLGLGDAREAPEAERVGAGKRQPCRASSVPVADRAFPVRLGGCWGRGRFSLGGGGGGGDGGGGDIGVGVHLCLLRWFYWLGQSVLGGVNFVRLQGRKPP